MAVITPNSDIYIIKCPIELDNLNQLSFANATAQHNYFNGLPKLALTGATFQRKDGTIRWPGSMENIMEYNYCMYRNKSHGNKWFYAFIENMTYVSDSTTDIKIKTDVWQTYQFDITWKACFVEREHVSNDTFGLHTLDEGLNPGEYFGQTATDFNFVGGTLTVAVQCSDLPAAVLDRSLSGGDSIRTRSRLYNGIPQGCYTLIFSGITQTEMGYQELFASLNGFLKWMDSDNKGDAVVAMYIIPASFLPANYYQNMTYFESSDSSQGFSAYVLSQSTAPFDLGSRTLFRNNHFQGYYPKNNKCFCYPFNYLLVTNNGGSDFAYHWEDFVDSNGVANPNFRAYGVLSQGCDVKFIPTNYKHTSGNYGYEWSVTGQKLPILSWSSDYYLNWQAKNGWNSVSNSIERIGKRDKALTEAQTPQNIFEQAGSVISSIVGYVGTGLNAITKTVSGQDYQAEITPDQAKGNANSGDLNYSMGKAGFTTYHMACKKEKIQIIDQYFSMYGYLVNSVKIPNISGRTNWNYVKTIGCNIVGDIPQSDLLEIKNIFNNGTTIWHNPSTFLDYSQNNNIV